MNPSETEIEIYNRAVEELTIREQKIKAAKKLGISYIDKYTEAIKKAKDENRNVFMLFYLDGCSGCTVIKHLLSYNQDVLNKINEKQYIVLKLDMSDAQCFLTHKYNVYSFPSYFVIDGDEKIIKQGQGCLVENGPDKYLLNWLNK